MPTLDEHHATRICKILLMGDSGSGKTGALASLANAGYKLGILDFDNGLDILVNYVKPDFTKNVHYVTLTDSMTFTDNGMGIPLGAPTAWLRAVKLLRHWKTEEEDLGPISRWGDDWVLVLDSLTILGRALMHYVKFMNNAILEPDWGFYGPAMEIQAKLLDMLFAKSIGCNIIVTAHIVPISPKKKVEVVGADGKTRIQQVDIGDAKLYPTALGNKLPPQVGRFFNASLKAETDASGSHWIKTQGTDELEIKNPFPTKVPRMLPLGSGLADYFRIVREAAPTKGDDPQEEKKDA